MQTLSELFRNHVRTFVQFLSIFFYKFAKQNQYVYDENPQYVMDMIPGGWIYNYRPQKSDSGGKTAVHPHRLAGAGANRKMGWGAISVPHPCIRP